jgi:hypothetical protein
MKPNLLTYGKEEVTLTKFYVFWSENFILNTQLKLHENSPTEAAEN